MENTDCINWFREASTYISEHKNKTCVVMLDHPVLLHENFQYIIQDLILLNRLGVRLILVHATVDIADHKPSIHTNSLEDNTVLNSLYTSIGAIKSKIEAILNKGLVNRPLKSNQQQLMSGHFITAKSMGIIDGINCQYQGHIRRINTQAIEQQLDQGNILLIPNCGHSYQGQLLQINIKEVTEQIAVKVNADKLILFNNKGGLLNNQDQIIKQLNQQELEEHIRKSPSSDRSKMALYAIKQTVNRVHILSYSNKEALLCEFFTYKGSGTLVTKSYHGQLRAATVQDIPSLLYLLTPLVEKSILIERSANQLEKDIEQFTLIDMDGMIAGCVAWYPLSNNFAELACLAIHDDYREDGYGDRLLKHIEYKTKQQKINQLLVLTTKARDWFIEKGFRLSKINDLPKERQQRYNHQRNSDILIKNLDH